MCREGQKVLDIGTGTGVLPRNLYSYGAKWVGTDISEEQIQQAKKLSEGMNIDYYVNATEDIAFAAESFDVITACQCFWYFEHKKVCHEEYLLNVHFTREKWHGRMKACRGVGASLSKEELEKWEFEHMKMLSEIAPEEFDVKHYAALVELQARK